MNTLQRLIKDESGATAIEYGLIAGLVAVAIIAALGTLGDSLNTLFSKLEINQSMIFCNSVNRASRIELSPESPSPR